MNADGDIAKWVSLFGTDGDSADNVGIFRFESGSSTVTPIAQKGDVMPGGGTYIPFEWVPAINDAGQVAFLVGIEGVSPYGSVAVLRGDGTQLEVMARTGDPLPGGEAIRQFSYTSEVALNNHGHVAFPVSSDISTFYAAVVVATAPGVFTEIARADTLVPDEPFTFYNFFRHIMLNDAGNVVFTALLTPTTPNEFRKDGIFLDGTLIAHDGEPVPDGDGLFNQIIYGPFALNETGQVTFKCGIDLNSGGSVKALFHYNGETVEEIIRVGDSLAEGIVDMIEFAGTTDDGVLPHSRNGMNDQGQVAFKFGLESGIEGIAIWSPDSSTVRWLESPKIHQESASQVRVAFPGIPGIPYKIETIDDLVDGTWTEAVGSHFVNAEGFCEFLLDIAALRFARIVFAR